MLRIKTAASRTRTYRTANALLLGRLAFLGLGCVVMAGAAPATVSVLGFNDAAITTAIRSACQGGGGIVAFPDGTYAINSTVGVPGGCTLRAQNPRKAVLSGSQNQLLSFNGNGISVDGLVFDGGYLAFGDGPAQYSNFRFTNNTIRNLTDNCGSNCPNGLFAPGLKNSVIDSNVASNLWPGGWPSPPQVVSCSGQQNVDCWGYAAMVFGSLDQTSITNNYFDKISKDSIYAIWEGTTGNAGGYTTYGVVIAYNTMTHQRRIPIELQSQPSGNCRGGCNYQITNTTGLEVKGNFVHDYSYPHYDTWGASLVPLGNLNGAFINNTFIANLDSDGHLDTRTAGPYWAPCEETGGDNLLVQGTVCASISTLGHGFGGTGFAIGSTANTSLTTTLQNVIQCGTGKAAGWAYETSAGRPLISYRYNYETGGPCPAGDANITASNIALNFDSANNQVVPGGSASKWTVSVVSNLSIKWVQFFLDNSSAPVAVQEVQDLNTNFGNDRRWLYHANVGTSNLSGGTHTLTAQAVDVSGAVQSATQSFQVSGGS